MERLSFLSFIAVFLMNMCLNRVCCAVTPVFVKKGDDVLLNVTGVPEKFTVLSWKHTTGGILVSFVPDKVPEIRSKYAGRVEPDVKNFSVKLKNLQKSDNGGYTARLTVDDDINLAEYNVTVLDPVSPVGLAVVNNTLNFCNVTVTCSTEDSHISSTFKCEKKTCYQEGGNTSKITKAGASLQLYLSNKLITCNHRNQVSQAKNETRILDSCKFPDLPSPFNYIPIVIGVAVVVVAAILGFLAVCHRKKGKYDRNSIEDTVYASPQDETVQIHDKNPAQDADSPSTTMYSMVGFSKGMDSSETKAEPQPETIYSEVQRSTRKSGTTADLI